MASLKLQLCRFVDHHQPGWVECRFSDIDNREWVIIEKVPVVTAKCLDESSIYPQEVDIPCEVLSSRVDSEGRHVFEITIEPWCIETVEGNSVFVVSEEALVT